MKYMSKNHPFFDIEEVWYIFGKFNVNCFATENLILHCMNNYEIQVVEAITSEDGSINDSCCVLFSSLTKPTVRSEFIKEITYSSFLDMIEQTRVNNPIIEGLIENSLNDENEENHDTQMCNSSISKIEEKVAIPTLDEMQLSQLKSGLIGLGFQKNAVNQFIKSVEHKNETLEKLVAEGVNVLSKGYQK